MPVTALERIWLGSSNTCDRNLPEHMCFDQVDYKAGIWQVQVQVAVEPVVRSKKPHHCQQGDTCPFVELAQVAGGPEGLCIIPRPASGRLLGTPDRM